MHEAILSASVTAILAISAALYRLGSIIGRLNQTVSGIDDDLRDIRSTAVATDKRLSNHARRLTTLEVISRPYPPTPV